jgi:hypothetical protein
MVHTVSDVMIPSVFPTRQQAEIQTRWAFEKASREPLVLYSLLAISAAERSARLGELRSGSQETTFTEEDLEKREVPDFVSYKLNAVRLASDSMRSMETAIKASTVFALMCLLSIEVCILLSLACKGRLLPVKYKGANLGQESANSITRPGLPGRTGKLPPDGVTFLQSYSTYADFVFPQVITGNQTEILAHVSGIQKLIAWRGGYHGIPPHATELILS